MSAKISEKEILLLGRIGTLNEEIERLNNTINEFEKWLDEEYQYADKHIFPGSMAGVAMGQINRTKK